MTAFNHDAFVAEWRRLRPAGGERIPQAEYDAVMAAIDGRWRPPAPAVATGLSWMIEAKRLIGTKEIPGPQHNSWIAKGWARLGATWFTDDETPWCGFFVAHCLEHAGIAYPGKGAFARALAWKDWGKDTPAAVGAVVVFQRSGGGHVGFLVGESLANYYVLGGNQSNAVTITPIDKARKVAIRWPASLPLPSPGLPKMSGGTVSRNEQ